MLPPEANVTLFQPHGWDWLTGLQIGNIEFRLESQYGCINLCVRKGDAIQEVMTPKKSGIDTGLEEIVEAIREKLAQQKDGEEQSSV